MSTAALETHGLHKSFGALTVANAVDFRLERGARHALIGPNGAGKTTFVELVTGALRPSAGQIHLDGADVTDLPQAARVKRGLVRTFQITALFRRLSVLENVTLAVCERQGIGGGLFRPAGHHRAAIEEAHTLLERLGLEDEALRPVNMLAYGRQRLIEIAVSLALSPKVLLLDEPAAGVPSGESGTIIEVIERLPSDIALADHRARHGSGFPAGAADHGLGARQRPGRRAARGDRRRSGGPQGLSRRAGTGMNGLVLEGVSAGYGETVVLEGISLDVAAGADTGGAGPQRRRQDDAARHNHGPHPIARRQYPLCRPRNLGAAPVSARSARHRFCAAGARNLSLADGRGKFDGRRAPGTGRTRRQWSLARVYDFFPSLAERRRNHGNQLSGGEQQMLAIGRALMGNPTLLLMDEPLEGLAPVIVDALLDRARPAEARG